MSEVIMEHSNSNSQTKGWNIFSNVCAFLIIFILFFGLAWIGLFAADKEALAKEQQRAEVVK